MSRRSSQGKKENKLNASKKLFPGLAAAFVLAGCAWICGQYVPVVGGPVFGILFGMGVALTGEYAILKDGTRFASKRILQLSVVLLGFEMNVWKVLAVGGESLIVMIFTLSTALLTAWWGGKMLKLPSVTTALIGVGTAICGGSAIAATAPVLNANDEEIAHSLSTIFLFNVAAVFIFPAVGHLLHMSDTGFGLWAGTAVNDTSSVLAAGYAYSDAAGKLATIVKLTRTLMIIPITFALSLCVARSSPNSENRFSFSKAFPWFILGFMAAAALNSSGMLQSEVPAKILAKSGKFLIVVAMSAIGLNTHLGKLLANGLRPVLLGLFCWLNLALVSLFVQFLTGVL